MMELFQILIIVLWILQFSAASGIVYCNTAFLDLNTNQWTSGPNLTTCRNFHTCNLITNPLGQQEIVVVGGQNTNLPNCEVLSSVEIINLRTNRVRNGEWQMQRDAWKMLSQSSLSLHVKGNEIWSKAESLHKALPKFRDRDGWNFTPQADECHSLQEQVYHKL